MHIISMIVVLFFAVLAFAAPQTSYELSCRAKAKEIAAETYRTCVSENKTAEIERLKKDYQERLRLLKDDYEVEISKLGLKKAKKSNSGPVAGASSERKKSYESDDSRMDLPEPIPVEVENQNSL